MTICYAVAHGFKRGLFEEWNEARKQVDNFPQPVFKKFSNRNEAEKYLEERIPHRIELIHPGPNFEKYYAVARARTVGVFTDFKDIKKYIEDYPLPLYKKFDNLNDAISFFEKFFNGVIKPSKNNDDRREAIDKNEPREADTSNKEGINISTYYAVAYGHETGVFTSWDDCKRQITGFKDAEYKKFDNEEAAKMFAKGRIYENDAKMSTGENSKRKHIVSDFDKEDERLMKMKK